MHYPGPLDTSQFANFARCGQEKLYRTCKCCGDTQEFDYRCSIKWCPLCNWRISQRRAELLRQWVKRIPNPKHIVTTQKNFPVLTRRKLRQHIVHLAKLRRKKVFQHVKGGCVSVEITNEGNGWHLHAHWLVDATFVSASELAIAWGKLIGQEYGIVKVITATEKNYAAEVAKYVVKGEQMAKWPREHVLEFVTAVKGVRFYFAFGELFKLARQIRAEINQNKPEASGCDCGSKDFIFEDEVSVVLREVRESLNRRPCKKSSLPSRSLRSPSDAAQLLIA